MREHLYRGKRRDNGEWVFGGYFKASEEEGLIHYVFDRIYGAVSVRIETVCQFALTLEGDINLFEGDTFHLGEPNITYTVVWHDTGLKGKQNGSSSFVGLEAWKKHMTITGNIHDK